LPEPSTHRLPVADSRDVARVLEDVAAIGGGQVLVAVNVSSDLSPTPEFFSERSLKVLLAAGCRQLQIETVPLAEYVSIVGGQIDRVIAEALALRAKLRACDVAEATSDVEAFLGHFDAAVLVVGGFVLQRRGHGDVPDLAPLDRLREQLARSSLALADNCRTMDGLQYEIVPGLNAVKRALEAHRCT
jgi:hypothetical protein